MVQLRNNCDCETCTGGETPERPNGEIVFGGWRCTCLCHQKALEKEEPNAIVIKVTEKENENELR